METMEKPTFNLKLQATGKEIGVAAFSALKASAWALYQATHSTFYATTGKEVPLETKRAIAAEAFRAVIEKLPPEDPVRTELQRYAEEIVPRLVVERPTRPTLARLC